MSRDNVIKRIRVFATVSALPVPVLKYILPESVLAGSLGYQLCAFNCVSNKSAFQRIDFDFKIYYFFGQFFKSCCKIICEVIWVLAVGIGTQEHDFCDIEVALFNAVR